MSQYFESHTNQFCPLQRHFDASLRLSDRLLSIQVYQSSSYRFGFCHFMAPGPMALALWPHILVSRTLRNGAVQCL